MTPRVVQETFLKANRAHFAHMLRLLPKDKRALFCKELQEKTGANSSLRYFMRQHCPSWRDTVIESYINGMVGAYTAIRDMRRDTKPPVEAFAPLRKHASLSVRRMRDAFRFSRFSYREVDITPSSNKARFLGVTGPLKELTYHISVPPSYVRFVDKLGTDGYRQYIILSGTLVTRPFGGAEVWYCEVLDTRKREQKALYIGRCGYLYVGHTKLGPCRSLIERAAAERALEAMHEEFLD